MTKTKIGIIGCGKQAPKHISGFKKISGIELVLTDIQKERAISLAKKEGLSIIEDPDDLFRDPSISAIDICTPTPSHAPLIKNALINHKDFFCEKPLCEHVDDAHKIQAMIQKSDCIGMVGFIYRFSSVFEIGHSLLNDLDKNGFSKAMGKVVSAAFRIGGRGSHQLWKHLHKMGGGAINEMMVHMVDLCIWFFGEVEHVSVITNDLLRPTREIQGIQETVDAEDFIMVKLIMKNGVSVFCQADLITPAFTQYVEIQGEHGSYFASIQPDMPSYIFCEKDTGAYKKGKNHLSQGPINLFEKQMAVFIEAVRSRQQPDRCTIADSVQTMTTIKKIQEEAAKQ